MQSKGHLWMDYLEGHPLLIKAKSLNCEELFMEKIPLSSVSELQAEGQE